MKALPDKKRKRRRGEGDNGVKGGRAGHRERSEAKKRRGMRK